MPTARDVMTAVPITLSEEKTVTDAARLMRDNAVGAVLVVRGDTLSGLVTDRDIALRAIADGRDPAASRIGDICSGAPVTARPGDDIAAVMELMRAHAVRRIPVVEDGRPVGLVSTGDIAATGQDTRSLRDLITARPDARPTSGPPEPHPSPALCGEPPRVSHRPEGPRPVA
jgi:CBS domain-containing protein